MVADDQRRYGGVIKVGEIADGFMPALRTVFDIEGHHVAIGCFEEEPIAGNGNAAIADLIAAGGGPLVVPELAAGAGVDGPGVIGHKEEEDAIDHQRGGFETAAEGDLRGEVIDPGERERIDVGGVDLLQGAVTAARVIAAVSGPGIGGSFGERSWIDALSCEGQGKRGRGNRGFQRGHLSVSRYATTS